VWRFFEAGEANPCQLWQPACNFAAMFWCIWIESVSLPFCIFSKLSIDKDDEVSMKLDYCMVFRKNKTDAMPCERFVFFRREPSASGATGGRLEVRSMLDGYCLQQGAGVVFVFLHSYHLKVKLFAMLTKTMTAPQPVATSRRA
jgi:hypothetical protein